MQSGFDGLARTTKLIELCQSVDEKVALAALRELRATMREVLELNGPGVDYTKQRDLIMQGTQPMYREDSIGALRGVEREANTVNWTDVTLTCARVLGQALGITDADRALPSPDELAPALRDMIFEPCTVRMPPSPVPVTTYRLRLWAVRFLVKAYNLTTLHNDHVTALLVLSRAALIHLYLRSIDVGFTYEPPCDAAASARVAYDLLPLMDKNGAAQTPNPE